jgi:hypothetical protein
MPRISLLSNRILAQPIMVEKPAPSPLRGEGWGEGSPWRKHGYFAGF